MARFCMVSRLKLNISLIFSRLIREKTKKTLKFTVTQNLHLKTISITGVCFMDNYCVCCGDIIPEGIMVCPGCEENVYSKSGNKEER